MKNNFETGVIQFIRLNGEFVAFTGGVVTVSYLDGTINTGVVSNISNYGFTLLSDFELTGPGSYGPGSYGPVTPYTYKKLIKLRDIVDISRK